MVTAGGDGMKTTVELLKWIDDYEGYFTAIGDLEPYDVEYVAAIRRIVVGAEAERAKVKRLRELLQSTYDQLLNTDTSPWDEKKIKAALAETEPKEG
jgi:hypothetical protein